MPFPGPVRRRAALVAALALVALAAACGGGNGGSRDSDETALSPIVVNFELALGQNRFVLALLTPDNQEVIGADVSLRFYPVGADAGESESVAAETVVFDKSYTHTHDDGTVETHGAGRSGVYMASVEFDETGQWNVDIDAGLDGTDYPTATTTFDVVEKARSVAVGAPAPQSVTLTVDDVEDISEIDTSDPPIPGMHEVTVAEAVTSGKPSLVVFATPAFCLSRICGPTKGIVDDLFEEYGERVNFVHVEPYDVGKARAGEGLFAVPAVAEWGLSGEPWVFVVGADGNVSAKFESIVTEAELRGALDAALGA